MIEVPAPERPEGGFSLIYPDPPWSYRDKAKAGLRGAEQKYPVMKLKQLKAMRPFIDSMAADDCAMALWVTSPLLPDGMELLKAWGFKYKTVLFVWAKLTKGVRAQITFMPKYHFGMGNWTRANSELCLLGVRGKIRRSVANVPQLIVSPLREHSRKPPEARERLERLFGDVPRLELFSRENVPGWTAWGLEAGQFNAPEPSTPPPSE